MVNTTRDTPTSTRTMNSSLRTMYAKRLTALLHHGARVGPRKKSGRGLGGCPGPGAIG